MIQSLEVKKLNNRLDGVFEFNEDLNILLDLMAQVRQHC